MDRIQFIDNKGSFTLSQPEAFSGLYFPIASECGIKSVVSPDLGGDSKMDQNTFLLEPTSIENLHNNRSGRNFWCLVEGKGYWSAAGRSAEAEAMRFTDTKEESQVTAGFMWHKTERASEKYGVAAKILSFVPYDKNTELMQVEITNTASVEQKITPIAAVPIYGRSADNLRDHRHVTSLLHRIRTTENGVYVRPTLSFDERGHQKNTWTYFVCGVDGEGNKPLAFYPTVDDFVGEGGTYTNPRAVAQNAKGLGAGYEVAGCEAVGAFKFSENIFAPGESKTYTVLIGATENEAEIEELIMAFDSKEKVAAALAATENYWNDKVNIHISTGDKDFDAYMRWVCLQPFLRRVYGCSFLPHHDYGKGGRGWRDLWQDCLALLIMDPSDVRQMILDNFGGVRVDGTNATIIGSKQGEFVADRNGITRVWMDHGMWPFLTTKLYMEQTGDVAILNSKVAYFKDRQVERGEAVDQAWDISQGNLQMTEAGSKYEGSVLEHLLLQHLCAMYEVGDHGIIRLRDADWNDALDMANVKGESVAFTCAYSGNLLKLAEYVRALAKENASTKLPLMKEFADFIGRDEACGEDKTKLLASFDEFKKAVRHSLSGQVAEVDAEYLAALLERKANQMMDHVRSQEWVTDSKGNGWFNSYYDNHGNFVEGEFADGVRMMLTGQVFSIMSETASKEQVASICKSADQYLYEKEIGGYRLNTDFKEEKYDMGRAFGFAYGEKENGAVFSHMTVMYAYALYLRGFVQEGHKALQSLADTALDFNTSMIYPGIPEYFNSKGRGLYHYLTGAASWYALTMVTEVFGVRGLKGALCLQPKLIKGQFDENREASIGLTFAGCEFTVTYVNEQGLEYGEYKATKCYLDGALIWEGSADAAEISKDKLEELSGGKHEVRVVLS